MPLSVVRLAAASIALFFSGPATAFDGEVLVNQAKVVAGGITAGDTLGFPATLSRAGRYKLSGNLAVPDGFNAIDVTQDNVTIDLHGFTIAGSHPAEAHYGVLAVNVHGFRVMNGTIAHFRFYGVYNPDSAFAVIEDMRLVSNGGAILTATDARIRNSTIVDGGIGIVCASRCLIERNVISGNATDGVLASDGTMVLGNAIGGNAGYGIFSGPVSVGYGDNVLAGNTGGGAQVGGPALQLHPNACIPACP